MFKIISDGSCDLGADLAKSLQVEIVPFYVSIDGETYKKEIEEVNVRDFYDFMVKNPSIFPKTSLPSVQDYLDVFQPLVQENIPIICICITTKFSGSYNSARTAKDMLLEDFPDAKITIINSGVNTVLQGLVVKEAVKLRNKGLSYDETLSKIQEILPSGRIFFTIENMDYLSQGGRIGKLLGSATKTLNLRPLIVLRNGEIHPGGIVRGRKKSILKILDQLIKYIREEGNDPSVFSLALGYGYNEEEAKEVFDLASTHIKESFPDKPFNLEFSLIGATISVHTGPHPLGFGILKKA